MRTPRQPTTEARLGRIWGRRLKARRVELGLSQSGVARASDLAQQSIARFEAGEQIPLDRTKLALARALGTTPTVLFEWPEMEDLVGAAA